MPEKLSGPFLLQFKQVMVVRTDLRMGRGKLAVQVAHAAVMGAFQVRRTRADWWDAWNFEGQAKICVKVSSLHELETVYQDALVKNLPVVKVEDRGLTQLDPGTITCIGIGPAPEGAIDRVTGKLKLL